MPDTTTTAGSPHLRRLAARVANTGARLVAHAETHHLDPAGLLGARLPWYTIRDHTGVPLTDTPATIFIFDEIGGSFGIDAGQFVREIQQITAPAIHVRINSPGGAVFDAVAIHNALRHHPAKVVCYVDALAASAASVIAVAGDEVVMMPGSQMMIHDASALIDGNADDMAKMATWLTRQSDNIADMYRIKAGGDIAGWRELMRAETWLFAAEAVDHGLADRTDETRQPVEDPDLDELMCRSHSLTQYRYPGRAGAPEPQPPAWTWARRAATPQSRGDDASRLLRLLGDLA